MRKLIFFLVTLLGIATALRAQTPQTTFTEANELFRTKSYSTAAAKYQQLIDQGYRDKALYYNAGNAYYKANHIGAAVYNYEKALQLSPRDEATRHNLDMLNQQIPNNPEALPLLFFQQWWITLTQLFSANGWAVMSIVFSWVLVAAIMVFFFYPGRRALAARIGMYAGTVLLVISLGMATLRYSEHLDTSSAIVMNAAVKAKAAPDAGAKDMFELQEGMKVAVLDHTQEYCKVQLVDGKTGWIACDNIKTL